MFLLDRTGVNANERGVLDERIRGFSGAPVWSIESFKPGSKQSLRKRKKTEMLEL